MGALVNLGETREEMSQVSSSATAAAAAAAAAVNTAAAAAAAVNKGRGANLFSPYLRAILSPPEGAFTLGGKRSLDQLERFANVDFKEAR